MNLSVVPWGFFPEASTAEQIERVAAAGADAIEILDLGELSPEEARDHAADHGIDVAVLQASGETVGIDNVAPAIVDPGSVEQSIAELESSIEAAAAADARNCLAVVGQRQPTVPRHEQRSAIVETFRSVAPAAEDAGVTVVPEVLNAVDDHPGYFLTDPGEAYSIAEAVDSPNVGFLLDVYHQQREHGNVVPTFESTIDHVEHVHFADAPGRNEPGTGELAMERILTALDELGYDGYVGAEFSATGDPDETLRDVVELVP
ncbi:Hydroxypyruvate isomerase [Salinarchaeum sp. Harcht-Bsk1]|uniref:hydroxypyruvate isomerase family protein n=1 Tax=Salinarchaeum sp. Harcht-Bsk1 TaxID=1333523 RepID=UPI0003424610|nr:TIM barrel protein [Salinarchaeum sp. Harcht-Bsk1]AGN02162.1 Hydroxypyruvate isomerase [Salinarchaeum sp. Harcht-Bsk1]